MSRPSDPQPGMKERSDTELLRCVSERDRDPRSARSAQAVFYERHVRYLYGTVLRMKPSMFEMAGLRAEDLVQDTFHRAFERAHTYDPGDTQDLDAERRRTRAWLGRIATRLLADALRRPNEIAATPLVERASTDRQSSPPSSRRRGRLQLVSEGLEQLSDREQDVLRVTALYQRAGEAHQRLPNDVSAELATRWGTTNENIRAIRSRAMKKLKAFLERRGAWGPETAAQPGEVS